MPVMLLRPTPSGNGKVPDPVPGQVARWIEGVRRGMFGVAYFAMWNTSFSSRDTGLLSGFEGMISRMCFHQR